MKELDFLPFGAQYYRAPTPLPCDWERDLKQMSDAGFNLIKIWAVWRSNNPAEGVYDFSDLAELMGLAEKYSLKVIINAIFDAAPSWFYKKYPDSMMVTADGVKLQPRTTACRQSGGSPGPCLHHPEGIRVRNEFLIAMAKQFVNHPALLAWDVWNEPFLGGGYEGNMVCYCEHSFKEFVAWLKRKYQTIDGLNDVWHTYYTSFEEVEMPICREGFLNMIDWRMFFSETVTEESNRRIAAVKAVDSEHPVMVHTVPMPFFTFINGCSDDYQLAKQCDWFGNSLGSYPYTATISKSAARGKTVISSEIHAVGGTTFGRPIQPDYEAIKRHILIPLSRGIKGFCFWQYRPERIGLESPAWGLTNLDGTPSAWMDMAKKLNDSIQPYREEILKHNSMPARIAVVNSPAQQVFCYCADGNAEKYYQATIGIFDLIYYLNYAVDMISPDMITDGLAEDYKVIYMPFPYLLDSKLAETLKKWIAKGGTLISDGFFGSYNADNGLHETTVPGFGFDKIFGVTEGRVMTASQFRNAYGAEWSKSTGNNEIKMKTVDGKELCGYYFSEGLLPNDAESLAYFDDGAVAVTSHSYGEGCAVLIGSLFGCLSTPQNAAFLDSVIARSGVKKTLEISANDIHADMIGERLLILSNNGCKAICSVPVPGKGIRDILTGVFFQSEKGRVTLSLDEKQSACFGLE